MTLYRFSQSCDGTPAQRHRPIGYQDSPDGVARCPLCAVLGAVAAAHSFSSINTDLISKASVVEAAKQAAIGD